MISNTALSCSKVSLSYGSKVVLDNISLSISAGQFVCIIGQSGTGKTSLLKILAGLKSPDDGSVKVKESMLEDPNDQLVKGHEEIQMIFQDYDLKPNMTVLENINYALLDYEDSYRTQRIVYLLDLCKLTEFQHHKVEQLSGGQAQRVAMARALATEPAVVLMDEPFSNLDPITKQSLLQESQSIAKATNTAIVLVTHDTRDAMEAADEILVLGDGKVLQSGSPKEIYEQPASRNVAELLGYINIIPTPLLHKLGTQLSDGDIEYAVWAENIMISANGDRSHIIKTVIYKGAFNLVKILAYDQILIAYDFTQRFIEGNKVSILIESKDLIRFKTD